MDIEDFDRREWVFYSCPCPLKLDHLLVSNFDGKEGGYGKETVFG